MRRRSFLAGFVGAIAALSGCSDGDDAGGQGTDDDQDWAGSPTPRRARPAIQADFEFDPSPDEPVASATVDSREVVANSDDRHPWSVAVWNDDDAERSVDVAVVGESVGRAIDRSVTLPARAYYRVSLAEPDRYAVQVDTADGPRYEYKVAESGFDCNSHDVWLRISPTGLVEYTRLSTMVACE